MPVHLLHLRLFLSAPQLRIDQIKSRFKNHSHSGSCRRSSDCVLFSRSKSMIEEAG